MVLVVRDVESDLRAGNLFLDEGDEWIAICHALLWDQVSGKSLKANKRFTSFKKFVQWGSENNYDLY